MSATTAVKQQRVLGYLPNDSPTTGKLLVFALQQVLTMFPATVLVAILTKFDVGVTLFASGLATIVALTVSAWRAKTYIPLYYGSSFSYIAPVVAIVAANSAGSDVIRGIRLAQGGIVMTGILNILLGFLIRYTGKKNLDRVLPPIVTGSVAIVIGISLAKAALDMAAVNWPISIVTLLITVVLAVYLRGRGFLGMLPILLGAVTGYLISLVFGLVDFKPVVEAAWLRVPRFTLPILNLGAVLAIAPIAIATIPESTAHLYQISLYVDRLAEDMGKKAVELKKLVGLNLVLDGIGDTINGLLGGCAGTNYGENNSLMAITRNYSGPVLVAAGLIAMILGFVGKLAALIGTLPTAVTGGLAIYLFGIIGLQGVALIQSEKVDLFDPQQLAVGASILVIGIGGSMFNGGMIPIFGGVPAIATASVFGILLNALFLIFPPRTVLKEEVKQGVEPIEAEVA